MATTPPTAEELEALVGTELPDGRFRIEPDAHRRAVAAMHWPDWNWPVAHPAYGHIALNSGMGMAREDFFALCGSTLRTGALFGRGVITYQRPMRIGAEYVISATIIGAERKSGRRAGSFDLVTVRLDATDETGQLVTELDETYVFLRGSADA